MPFFQTVPLGCDEGTIKLHFNRREDTKRAGYFSTTLYYRSEKDFTKTDYYFGIKIYTLLINDHPKDHPNDHPYFKDVGLIIYTDGASYPLLAKHFGAVPKVIIAEVSWPRFMLRKNQIEGTVLRCMRYQAKVIFPGAWIAVRDADTLFAYEINNALIKRQLQFVSPVGKLITDITLRSNMEDILKMLAMLIGKWETTFISNWLLADNKIVLSTNDKYRASWHKEFPFTYAPRPYPTNSNFKDENYKYVTERDHITRLLGEGRSKFGVLFDAPLGVYAGFSHLAANAPRDFWRTCCEYLISHYRVVRDTLRDRMIISNTYSSIGAIGKDERMLIFGAMPAYFDDIYFVHLDYYGGLEFREPIFAPGRPRPPVLKKLRIETDYIEIPEPDADPVAKKDLRDPEVKIGRATFQSLLLSGRYAINLYDLPYVYEYETANEFVLQEDGTMNEHFKGIFARMLKEYARFKRDSLEIGSTALEKFGAAVKNEGKILIPSLKETVFEPITAIKPQVFVRVRNEEEPLNNRAETRRQQKAKTMRKKTRRFRPNLRDNGENENN